MRHSRPVNIFFDVDDTLITWDVRLRPGVVETFTRLREDGHTLYLWSGFGPRWEVVRRFALHDHILDCFWKPLYNHHARLEELGVPFRPDFVIDDHEEIVQAFGGFHIQPAGLPFVEDREMERVYAAILAHPAR
jgi:FMN phosphatase YigB (HAD superfamily)